MPFRPGYWVPSGLTAAALKGMTSKTGSFTLNFATDFLGMAEALRPVAGDVVVVGAFGGSTFGNATVLAPSGWTIAAEDDDSLSTAIAARKIDGTETTVTFLSDNSGTPSDAIMLIGVYSGSGRAIAAGSGDVSSSVNDPSSITINTSLAARPTLVFAFYAVTGASDLTDAETDFRLSGGGSTDINDHETTTNVSNTRAYLKGKIYNADALQNVLLDLNDNGSFNAVAGAWIDL